MHYDLIDSYNTIQEIWDRLELAEEVQSHGTRMLLEFNFTSSPPPGTGIVINGVNWGLRQLGVTHWPELDQIAFLSGNKLYIAWVRGPAWGAAVIHILKTFFASKIGLILLGIFGFSLLWRVLPVGIQEPIGEFLNILPFIGSIAIMALIIGIMPEFVKRVPEKILPRRK